MRSITTPTAGQISPSRVLVMVHFRMVFLCVPNFKWNRLIIELDPSWIGEGARLRTQIDESRQRPAPLRAAGHALQGKVNVSSYRLDLENGCSYSQTVFSIEYIS